MIGTYVIGEKSKALECFEKALKLDPNNSDFEKKIKIERVKTFANRVDGSVHN